MTDEMHTAWAAFTTAHQQYITARDAVLASKNHLGIIAVGLANPNTRCAAFSLLDDLTQHGYRMDILEALFVDLLEIATSLNPHTGHAQALIDRLPRAWLVANIRTASERILQKNTDVAYRGVFRLYMHYHVELAYKLADRALIHNDPSIVEAGFDFQRELDALVHG